MGIGAMRSTVEIQSRTRTGDGAGGVESQWTTVETRRAQIVSKRGQERLEGMQIEDQISHIFTFRYRADKTITAAQRLRYDNRIFNINAVINLDERNRYLMVYCKEGVSL